MISTFRFNGILLSQVTPDGDLITGISSIMMMEGWNWEDAAYKVDNGIHFKWPRKTYPPSRRSGSTEFRSNTNYKSTVDKIHKFLIDSRSYFVRIYLSFISILCMYSDCILHFHCLHKEIEDCY